MDKKLLDQFVEEYIKENEESIKKDELQPFNKSLRICFCKFYKTHTGNELDYKDVKSFNDYVYVWRKVWAVRSKH